MKNGLIIFAKNPDSKNAALTCANTLEGIKYQALAQIAPKGIKVFENIGIGKFSYPSDPEDIQLINTIYSLLSDNSMNENVISLNRELSEILYAFENCVQNDDTTIVFTKNELDGLSEKMLNDYEKTTKDGEEAYIIKLNNSNSYNIINYAKNESTRRTFYKSINTICEPNVNRFKEIINIRTKIANASGYETFSDYQLKNYMAKNLKTATGFLEDIKQKLQPKAKNEIEKMLELKNNERIKLNETITDVFSYWDQDYFTRISKEEKSSVSFEEIKEYFPVDMVLPEIIKIFEELYSLKFIKNENPSVWHDSVLQYEVYDTTINDYLGTMFLDLYEHEGKYFGGVTYPINYYSKKEDGSETHPINIVSVNLSKSTTSESTLLSHNDIILLFHELGHGIHILNIKSKWIANLLNIIKPDFDEIPSQMQENLAWEPIILERISHHYKDHTKKIPKKLIDSLLRTKNVGVSLSNLNQVFLGLGDLKLYSMGEVDKDFDIVKLWNDLRRDVTMLNVTDEYWDFAIMLHLSISMPSGYFTYLWSLVLAQDIYSKFSENGIINPEIGLKYRNTVLKSSGYSDSMEYIKAFLGREPNNDAFIKVIGI